MDYRRVFFYLFLIIFDIIRNISVQSIPRPSDLYYAKLTPRLKEAGIAIDNRKEWPNAILKEVFQELVKETPSDLLSR